MTNVLFIYESYEPTNAELYSSFEKAQWRQPFRIKKCLALRVTPEELSWCDVIVSVRSTSDIEWRLAKYAQKLGKFWILMLDDDFLSLGDSYGKDGQGYSTARKNNLKRLLPYVNCLLAVNKLLAEKYVSIGDIPRYALTNTTFDPSKMVAPQISADKIKIVFYVNDGTREMFECYLRPLIVDLYRDYADRVAMYFMAVRPDLSSFEDRLEIHYIPHMSYPDFLRYMAEQHFDIGVAPLNEGGFSKYKYFNKYVEYTRAGIAGIYSKCSLYCQVIESGYNGILCQNTPESWFDAVREMIENPQKRKTIAENAQQYAVENFSDDAVVSKLLKDIPEIVCYKAPQRKVASWRFFIMRLQYFGFRVRGWMNTVLNCVRSGNTKALLARAKDRIGRL